MEFIKTRNDLIYILNPALLLIGLFLFIKTPIVVIFFFCAFWLALFCALFLIASKHGSKRLAHTEDDVAIRLPLVQWLFCIALLQLSFFGVYFGIAAISGTILPVNTEMHPHLFAETVSAQFFTNGLFPWSLYAVIAVGMGYLGYRQQNNAYFSTLLEPFTHQSPQETWSVIINTGMRRAILITLGITLMFMMILFISLILPPEIHLPAGFHAITIFSTLILIVFSYTKILKRYVSRIFSRHIPTAVAFPIFCVGLGFILLFVTITMGSMTSQISLQPLPSLITDWINLNWGRLWIFFTGMWCCALAPLVCSYIARISRGYRVRDIILGVLALPILITVFFILAQYFHLPMIILPILAVKCIALISFLILLPLLVNHANSASAIIAYFPKNGVGKPRDHQPFFQKVAQFAVIGLYFYLVLGINGLSFLIFTVNFYILATLFFVLPAIIKNIVRS